MRSYVTAACLLSVTLSGAFAQDIKLETPKDKASYVIGRNIGETISGDGIELNIDNLIVGLREALAGKDSKISREDSQKVMAEFQKEMQKQIAAKAEAKAKANQEAGKKFLEDNKKREGVKVTESGLQYEVIKAGDGDKPKASDTVTVHYHGTLTDGTVFDSSIERKEPTSFPVGGVIAGWTEALKLMPVGAKWKLYIPSELAYGARGAGRDIGPHATLVFEVELLSIKGEDAPAPE